jgi:hypothetical protein
MTMQHATGTFDVKITPEGSKAAPQGGVPTARMELAKTFTGGMTGTAVGTMMTAGAPEPGQAAVYVAIDQFDGSVDGRAGGFILIHRGMMTKAGAGDLSVVIAPDTGTGELAGIEGSFTIEMAGGVHRYDLAYTLPGSSPGAD